jgi:hypothetical protein
MKDAVERFAQFLIEVFYRQHRPAADAADHEICTGLSTIFVDAAQGAAAPPRGAAVSRALSLQRWHSSTSVHAASESGTTLNHSGTTTMKKLSSEAGARDEDLSFISTPSVRQLLENRENASGNGGFVWQDNAVAARPAFASNDCPSASMIVGPWPEVVVGQWGPPGITLELNPYEQTKFRAGII